MINFYINIFRLEIPKSLTILQYQIVRTHQPPTAQQQNYTRKVARNKIRKGNGIRSN